MPGTDVKSTPVIEVRFDGTLFANRHSVEITKSLDNILAEATVVCPLATLPSTVGLMTRITLTGGRASGTSVLRFTGRVVGFEESIYPTHVLLHCEGNLVKAKHTKPKVPGGHKLHGKTDQGAVGFMLAEAGYDVSEYTLAGDSIVLGTTVADQDKDTRFLWGGRLSALDMIQIVDAAGGDENGAYRTHDFTPDGTIKREKHSRKPKNTADFSFTEGVDIIVPTNSRVTRPFPVDQVLASGPKNKKHMTSDPSGQTPLGTDPATTLFHSPLIEQSLSGDGGGFSAEKSSRFHDAQKKKNEVYLTMTTWRDDVILPGKTIGVNALTRMELNDKFVVQSVRLNWDVSNHFLQSLDTIGVLGNRQLNIPGGGGGDPGGGGGGGGVGAGPCVTFVAGLFFPSTAVIAWTIPPGNKRETRGNMSLFVNNPDGSSTFYSFAGGEWRSDTSLHLIKFQGFSGDVGESFDGGCVFVRTQSKTNLTPTLPISGSGNGAVTTAWASGGHAWLGVQFPNNGLGGIYHSLDDGKNFTRIFDAGAAISADAVYGGIQTVWYVASRDLIEQRRVFWLSRNSPIPHDTSLAGNFFHQFGTINVAYGGDDSYCLVNTIGQFGSPEVVYRLDQSGTAIAVGDFAFGNNLSATSPDGVHWYGKITSGDWVTSSNAGSVWANHGTSYVPDSTSFDFVHSRLWGIKHDPTEAIVKYSDDYGVTWTTYQVTSPASPIMTTAQTICAVGSR
jgi:hypothetical protein